jgi:hypothetical protein
MNGRPKAFPEIRFFDEHPVDTEEGMDLRDYFAGQALAGLFANPTIVPAIKETHLADMAYKIAEMMMQRRKE